MRNREYKIWDSATSKMYDEHSYSVHIYLNGSVSISGGWATSDCVMLDFTGIIDKNDKKIFEGDITNYGIVKWYDNLNWDSGGSPHPGFYLTRLSFRNDDGELDYHIGFFNDIEVLGNIYENPELIKYHDR